MAGEKVEQPVTVENVIDGAIIEGFRGGIDMFMESLEDSLRRDIILTEAGGAEKVLQDMINESQTSKVEQELANEAGDLQNKLKSVLG